MMAFRFCDDVWPRNNEKYAHPEERKERINLTTTLPIHHITTIEIEIDHSKQLTTLHILCLIRSAYFTSIF
jgi:hypothetical protein